MRESVIYQEILAEGEDRGRTLERRLIAKNLLNSGMSREQVEAATHLSLSEVEEIQRELE
ncbi:MAG: hypothetical protein AAGG02_09820 [Cyanobacteria bacterium P01_H01_bin.15]